MTPRAAAIELSRPSDPGGTAAGVARVAWKNGYAALQLKQTQYAPLLSDLDGLRQHLGDIRVSSLIWLGDAVESRDELLEVAAAGASLGAVRVVVCDTAERSRPMAVARRAVALDRVAGELADAGAALSLHHHSGHPVESVADIRDLIAAAPRVRVTIDTGHLGRTGGEPMQGVLTELGARVDNVHLKDLDADGAFRLVGEGMLPLREVVAEYLSLDAEPTMCIDEESWAPLSSGLARSMAVLRDWGFPAASD